MSRMDDQNRKMKEQGYGGHELQAENDRLRRALAQVSNLPQEILGELETLKRENQSLRSDTVKLLKKVDRII